MALQLRPTQFADLRTSLVQWYGTTVARYHESHDDDVVDRITGGAGRKSVAERLEATLKAARLFLVGDDMHDLCVAAGASFPCAPLRWRDFPAVAGLVAWNGEPIQRHVSKRTGELQDVVALAWQLTFGRVDDPDSPVQPVGVYFKPYEDRDGGTWPEGSDEAQGRAGARVVYRRFVPLSGVWMPFGGIAANETEWHSGMWASPSLRVLMATLALMAQEIGEVETEVDRRAAKRGRRAGVTDDNRVSVIHLRRREQKSKPGESSTVDWSSRWIVSGHWRQQWYSRTEEHRPIWIAPYVKGPEELPVRVREKVTVFDRSAS